MGTGVSYQAAASSLFFFMVLVLAGCQGPGVNSYSFDPKPQLFSSEGPILDPLPTPRVEGGENPHTPPPTLPPGIDDPEGLHGGHFDLDTSHKVYPLSAGTTDHHVHEYDDKYHTNTMNFFGLADPKFGEIQELIPDPQQRFVLIVSNAELSKSGMLQINNNVLNVLDYQNASRSKLQSGGSLQVFTLGVPQVAGDQQLSSFKLAFPVDAIASGGIIPTATGCVRKNEPGAKGEYRNGALVVQAVRADAVDLDPSLGVARSSSDLLWEATVFWHWDGACYGK